MVIVNKEKSTTLRQTESPVSSLNCSSRDNLVSTDYLDTKILSIQTGSLVEKYFSRGQSLSSDYGVCSLSSQTGLVLSQEELKAAEDASLSITMPGVTYCFHDVIVTTTTSCSLPKFCSLPVGVSGDEVIMRDQIPKDGFQENTFVPSADDYITDFVSLSVTHPSMILVRDNVVSAKSADVDYCPLPGTKAKYISEERSCFK